MIPNNIEYRGHVPRIAVGFLMMGVILAIILVSGGIAQAQAQPPDIKNATTFTGSVSINGAAAPDGTCILAFGGGGGTDCPGTEAGGTTNGRYGITVLFQDVPETITFTINGAAAAQTWSLKESDKGETISLNLSLPAGGGHGAGSGGGAIEIRGEVAEGPYEWDANNFQGFFYDFQWDVKTETLNVSSINGRTIPADNLFYSTSPQEVKFTYTGFGKYQVIGFMADKYFAGYTANTNPPNTRPATDFSGISALSHGELHRVLMDDDTKRTISVGGTLALQDGYVLKAKDIDINARTMLLSLLKDGNEVDVSPLAAGETYVYSKTVGSVENLPLIMVRFESVFSGQELQVAFMKGLFQISEGATLVKIGDKFDIMNVTNVTRDGIMMTNYLDAGLYKNTNVALMGNLKFKVADADSLRYYPFVEFTQPGKYEVRGQVFNGSTTPSWNGKTFAGFYYDLKYGRYTEVLNIIRTLNNDRIISKDELVYQTTKIPVYFKAYEKEGVLINGQNLYDVVGWQGEEHVAIKGAANKLAKLVFEMGNDDKKTMILGETWSLGAGYELKVNDIDVRATPRQAWFTLIKDGIVIDEAVVQARTGSSIADKQRAVYSRSITIQGEPDVLLFTIYVDTIFSGATSDMVQFKYAWLIDSDSSREIRAGDIFGDLEVRQANYWNISISNEVAINLSSNTEQEFFGDFKLKVADSDQLRFYLKKDYVIPDQSVLPSAPSILINNGDAHSSSTTVTLGVSAGNATEMSFSNDFIYWSGWEPFSATKIWKLSRKDGLKTVYFKARNNAGEASPVSDTIILETMPIVNKVEIRGTVASEPALVPSWDAQNFAWFYYDLKYDRSAESLNFIKPLANYTGRSIPRTELEYSTSKVDIQFKANEKEGVTVLNSPNYQLVGWQGEKWIAVKGIANKIAQLAFEMGKDDKKTLTAGETWSLGSGYELTINSVDARATPRQVWFTLKKNGAIIDEGIGQAPASSTQADKQKAVFTRTKTILGESDSLLFTVYVDSIFSGATSDMVQFKYAWLIDEGSAKEIKPADKFGVFEVREANADIIRLTNENPVSLSSNSETTLLGNLKFRVADNSSVLRFYPFVEYTMPGTYEVRGRVAQDMIEIPKWNAQSFAGFYYDLKYDRQTESLNFTKPLSTYSVTRSIPKTELEYSTRKVNAQFKANEKENVTVSGMSNYQLVGWQAEKYIAINGMANKLAKLVLEMDKEEKKTLAIGETWALGASYELTVNSINATATPKQVFFTLKKEGIIIDEGIAQAPTDNTQAAKQKAVYTRTKTILGEPDSLLFTVYVDSIFLGATSEMVQFRYAWLIDESSAKEIKAADKFGVFEVREATSERIVLTNENSVSLSSNSEITLMGNLKFRVADNSSVLRFYPKVDYMIGGEELPFSLSISINQGDDYARSASVNLNVNAVNATNMSFSNDGLSWSPWEPFKTTKSWTLTGGNGLKTVYFKARNNAGEAPPVSDTIILETIPVVNKIEIRGTVVSALDTPALIPFWDAQNFAGFYYDLKYDRQTEDLHFTKPLSAYSSNRSIPRTELEYSTRKVDVQFKANEKEGVTVLNSPNYQLVGWQGEKWIAVNDKANKIAQLAFEMGKDDKKTLTTGENWSLGAGYELTINAVDARAWPRQVWFTLKKDGAVVDEGIGQTPTGSTPDLKQKAVYHKTKTILGESDSLLFTIYVDSIFSGATSDMVQFKYAWLIDEGSAKEIKAADKFGVFEVREATSDIIRLTNEKPVSLSSNSETTLMGNLGFRIADNSSVLRFYPFVSYTNPGTYEVRGTVVDAQGTPTLMPTWDAQNFPGFYYNLKYNRSTESLAFIAHNLGFYQGQRSIDKEGLQYRTRKIYVDFKAFEKENVGIIGPNNTYYPLVGWQGEKWIGINDNANKVARLAFEMDKEDIKTLTTGDTWSLGAGYELTIDAIDTKVTPRQVWFTLKKDGEVVDEGIGQAAGSTPELKQKAVYYKTKTILGESDSLLFTLYVDSIFSGATSDMVQFKYAWLIDESSAMEVKSADRFGVFEVRTADKDQVTLTNENSISLSSNSETTLMGNLKFRVADNNSVLRFYPKVDYVIKGEELPSFLSISINNGNAYTNSTSVTLNVSAINATNMSFSNDNTSWSAWEPYATTKSWILTDGDGQKTVHFKARNAGGESGPVSDTIDLVSTITNCTIAGTITNVLMVPIAGATVDLMNASGVVASTVTNASGGFNFTNVIPGNYNVNASQPRFFGNSTSLAVAAGSTNSVSLILWLKGDLNNNGLAADAVDVNMMIQASVGDIIADWRYDLDGDGFIATAVDVNMMIQASVGDLIF